MVAKVNLVMHHEPSVAAPFHVALVKLASVISIFGTFAVLVAILLAVVYVARRTLIQIVVIVDVPAAGRFTIVRVAVAFAWHCRDGAPCVQD